MEVPYDKQALLESQSCLVVSLPAA